MRNNITTTLYIKKPKTPARVVLPSEIPTKEEIQKRLIRLERLKRLGIEPLTLDSELTEQDGAEDLDKLQASILIMQDKEVPRELEQRILEKNRDIKKSIKKG